MQRNSDVTGMVSRAAAGALDRHVPEAAARLVELDHPVPRRTSMFGCFFDALDQIRGHRLRETVAAHHHAHARARGGQVHHRLAGGVARSNDHHVLTRALHRLAAAGAVVHAVTQQLLDTVELEPPPLHPARHQHDVGGDLVAARELPARRLAGREMAAHHPVAGSAARRRSAPPACPRGAPAPLRRSRPRSRRSSRSSTCARPGRPARPPRRPPWRGRRTRHTPPRARPAGPAPTIIRS